MPGYRRMIVASARSYHVLISFRSGRQVYLHLAKFACILDEFKTHPRLAQHSTEIDSRQVVDQI